LESNACHILEGEGMKTLVIEKNRQIYKGGSCRCARMLELQQWWKGLARELEEDIESIESENLV